jgi:hypothetical protein
LGVELTVDIAKMRLAGFEDCNPIFGDPVPAWRCVRQFAYFPHSAAGLISKYNLF